MCQLETGDIEIQRPDYQLFKLKGNGGIYCYPVQETRLYLDFIELEKRAIDFFF